MKQINTGYEVRAPTWQRISALTRNRRRNTAVFLCSNKNTIFYSRKAAESEEKYMAFFTSAVGVLQTLVIALGAGLAIWGVVNLMEGYGNDNPGAKSQGMKQLMAGGGVALIGLTLVPLLAGLFS